MFYDCNLPFSRLMSRLVCVVFTLSATIYASDVRQEGGVNPVSVHVEQRSHFIVTQPMQQGSQRPAYPEVVSVKLKALKSELKQIQKPILAALQEQHASLYAASAMAKESGDGAARDRLRGKISDIENSAKRSNADWLNVYNEIERLKQSVTERQPLNFTAITIKNKWLETVVAPELGMRILNAIDFERGAVLQASGKAGDFAHMVAPNGNPDRACFIGAQDAENIAITGHGHIDGNRPVLDMDRYFKGMVKLVACSSIRIDGPVFSDACGWNTTPRHSKQVYISRLKIFNNRPRLSCINTDGCNPDGCEHVRIEHCMMHTGDDAVAVKSTNYGGDAHDCCDIVIRDLLAVNNSTTAKIGTETVGKRMANIHFERVCAVRTTRLVGLDAYDFAQIGAVSRKDCVVAECDPSWVPAYLIDIQAPSAKTAFRSIPAQSTVSGVSLNSIRGPAGATARVLQRADAVSDVQAIDIYAGDKAIELEWIESSAPASVE